MGKLTSEHNANHNCWWLKRLLSETNQKKRHNEESTIDYSRTGSEKSTACHTPCPIQAPYTIVYAVILYRASTTSVEPELRMNAKLCKECYRDNPRWRLISRLAKKRVCQRASYSTTMLQKYLFCHRALRSDGGPIWLRRACIGPHNAVRCHRARLGGRQEAVSLSSFMMII
jgi:hypothetical protein